MVWDERKREIDLAKRGLDSADARDRFLFEGSVVVPSYPEPDGRARCVAIGVRDGRLVAAVIAPPGSEALLSIGLHPASRVERRIYENA